MESAHHSLTAVAHVAMFQKQEKQKLFLFSKFKQALKESSCQKVS